MVVQACSKRLFWMQNPSILEIRKVSEILQYANFVQRQPVARGHRRSSARRQILWQLAFRCRCLDKTGASPPSICAQPQVMGPLPLGISFLPQGIGVAPRIMGLLPRKTGLLPQSIGAMPQIMGPLPPIMGLLPRIMGLLPRITGFLPRYFGWDRII